MSEADEDKAIYLSPISAEISGNSGMSVSRPSLSHSFAGTHLQSAIIMSSECAKIEALSPNDEISIEYLQARQLAYSTTTLFSSVAFLEAFINELFERVGLNDPNVSIPDPFTIEIVNKWGEIKNDYSYSILDKYELFLSLIHITSLDEDAGINPPVLGSKPDILDLLEIRNSLTHYKHLWEGPNETKKVRRIRERLNSRFGKYPNPFCPKDSNVYFLNKYLCYVFSRWAVKTSAEFVNAFSVEAGILNLPHEYLLKDIY